MVSEQMDMLDEADARPDDTSTVSDHAVQRRINLAEEIATNGEALLELTDGRTVEVHGHDAHFFPYEGVIMTEVDDAEEWVFAEEIVSVKRH